MMWRPRQLTYDEAAKVAGVAVATLKDWRRDGMPMGTDTRGRRVVREDVLLEWKRRKLKANPTRRRRRAG